MRYHVIGRGHNNDWSKRLSDLRYIGAVSLSPDKSNRHEDIVQSLPCNSPSEAAGRGRRLREILIAQDDGSKVLVRGKFI